MLAVAVLLFSSGDSASDVLKRHCDRLWKAERLRASIIWEGGGRGGGGPSRMREESEIFLEKPDKERLIVWDGRLEKRRRGKAIVFIDHHFKTYWVPAEKGMLCGDAFAPFFGIRPYGKATKGAWLDMSRYDGEYLKVAAVDVGLNVSPHVKLVLHAGNAWPIEILASTDLAEYRTTFPQIRLNEPAGGEYQFDVPEGYKLQKTH